MMVPSAEQSSRLLAAKYLHAQAKQLASQLEGAVAGVEDEPVHRVRVASRRLRAAFSLFESCLPKKKVKRWRKSLRRIARGLGPARDHDVHSVCLSEHLANLKDARLCRGVALLLAELDHARADVQPDVVAAVERFRASGVLDDIFATAKAELVEAKTARTKLRDPEVLQRTQRAIVEACDALCCHEDSLNNPKDVQRHHAMRIAAKRLRYTMEIAKPVYQGRLDAGIAATRKLQTLLGTIHDCDVWSGRLAEFRAAQRRRFRAAYAGEGPWSRTRIGIEHLQRECRKQRRRVFKELGAYWKRWRRECRLPREAGFPEETAATPEGDDGFAVSHDAG